MPAKKNRATRKNVSVTCPACAASTEFSFQEKLPERSQLRCSKCRQDLAKEFLSIILAKDLEHFLSLRRRLLLIIALPLVSIVFLVVYLTQHPAHFLHYLLLAILLFILLSLFGVWTRLSQEIRKIQKLRQEYEL